METSFRQENHWRVFFDQEEILWSEWYDFKKRSHFFAIKKRRRRRNLKHRRDFPIVLLPSHSLDVSFLSPCTSFSSLNHVIAFHSFTRTLCSWCYMVVQECERETDSFTHVCSWSLVCTFNLLRYTRSEFFLISCLQSWYIVTSMWGQSYIGKLVNVFENCFSLYVYVCVWE